MIHVCTFEEPAWNINEIKRYARLRGADSTYDHLIQECVAEAKPALSYRVCYTELNVEHAGDTLYIGSIPTPSKTVQKALEGAHTALLFAATVGAPFDRLIQRYSRVSPSKALIMQAIGAERVESLCDAFCFQYNEGIKREGDCLTPRVSPGYGDIPLSMQKDIFTILDCPRKIGLTLDESMMMSPSKSVTALAGIVNTCSQSVNNKCTDCDKNDCAYRTVRES